MTSDAEAGSDWKRFLRKHWGVVPIFAVALVLAFVGVVYVFRWFATNAQSTGLVPSSLGLWTMGNLVTFILGTILWELVLIGIPVVVGGVIVWQWWKRLPEADWKWYRFGKPRRRTGGSGGGSLAFFILFCIKVYLDGNWNVPIATWSLDYVVDSVILILVLVAVILGIPGAIFGTWWIRREMKKV